MGDVNTLYSAAYRMVVYCAWRNLVVAGVLFVLLVLASIVLWHVVKDGDDCDGLVSFLGLSGAVILFITVLCFGVSAIDGFVNTQHLAQTTVYEMQRPSVPVKED